MINNDKGCINTDCIEAMCAGRTLDDPAGVQDGDTEYLSRLLQLPTAKPVELQADASDFDLWSGDRQGEML